MQTAIVHFEIHVADIERAKRFYTHVFDWKIELWEGTEYFGVWTGRSKYPNGSIVGMDGGLRKREGETPHENSPVNSFLCTIEITNIEQTLARIEEYHGKIWNPKVLFQVLDGKHSVLTQKEINLASCKTTLQRNKSEGNYP
jgi:uncharacterized protein